MVQRKDRKHSMWLEKIFTYFSCTYFYYFRLLLARFLFKFSIFNLSSNFKFALNAMQLFIYAYYIMLKSFNPDIRSKLNYQTSSRGFLDTVRNEIRYCKWTWLISDETTDRTSTPSTIRRPGVNFAPLPLRFDNCYSHLHFFRIFRPYPISIIRFGQPFRAYRSKNFGFR